MHSNRLGTKAMIAAGAVLGILGAACSNKTTPTTTPSQSTATSPSATSAVPPSASAAHAAERSIAATVSGHGTRATVTIDDSYARGSNLTKVIYRMRDGYAKAVVFPPPGARVYGEDIALCGSLGVPFYTIGFIGTGVECHPVLHSTEVFYHQNMGDLMGSFIPARSVVVTETATGSGHFLTVGHIDHGAMTKIEYYWADGEDLVVHLPASALVSHITLITSNSTPTVFAHETLSIYP